MNAPLGSGLTNTTPNSLQALTVPDTASNGYYYNKISGKFEGHLTTKTGNVNDVYACTGKTGNGENATYNGAVRLDITHIKFQICCNIIMQEGLSTDENEYIYLAFAALNACHGQTSHLYSKLMSSFSSVSQSDKIPLPDSQNTVRAKFSRKGILQSLIGLPDPSGAAILWDGIDFLAWGLLSPNGTPQNKFEEHKSIFIPKAIYDQFLAKILSKYTTGTVHYGSTPYHIPQNVFPSHINIQTGDFFYTTGVINAPKLIAVSTAGYTVFWKEEP